MSVETMIRDACEAYTTFEYPILVPVMNFVVEPDTTSSRLVGASVIVSEK
jgi:hypothetical protein